MKRWIGTLLSGLFLFLIAGCATAEEIDVEKINAIRKENIYPAILEKVDSVRIDYSAPHAPEGERKISYSFAKGGRGLEYFLTWGNEKTIQECYMEGIFYHMDSAGNFVVLFYDQTPEAYFEEMLNSRWSEEDTAMQGRTLTVAQHSQGLLYTLTYPCTQQSRWWGAQAGDTLVESHLVNAEGLLLQQEIGYRSKKQTMPQMTELTMLAATTYTYSMPLQIPDFVQQVWDKGEYATVTVRGAADQKSLPEKVYTVPKGMACRIDTKRSVFWDAAGRQSVESTAIPIDDDITLYLGSEKDR